MPQELNPREVLFYLNELGYTNITAQQLKEFMIDLKKLLKYKEENDETSDYPCREKYKKQCVNESEKSRSTFKPPSETNSDFCDYPGRESRDKNYDAENENSYESCDSECRQQCNFPIRDVFSDLYNTDTISSRAKSRKKENVIRVQINRPKVAKSNSEVATDTVDLVSSARGTSECRQSPVVESAVTEVQKCPTCNTARTIDTVGMEKKGGEAEKKGRMRTKSSFIRPRLNTKPPKSDPVALYHQYKEEWKKHKIPGMENHSQVRWCIREKLLGGDKYDYCY